MTEESDFVFEPRQTEPDGGVVPAPPKVVIEYRDRGLSSLFIPPLLLILAVMAVLVSRRDGALEIPPPKLVIKPQLPSPAQPSAPTTGKPVSPARTEVTRLPLSNSPMGDPPFDVPDLDDLMGTTPAQPFDEKKERHLTSKPKVDLASTNAQAISTQVEPTDLEADTEAEDEAGGPDAIEPPLTTEEPRRGITKIDPPVIVVEPEPQADSPSADPKDPPRREIPLAVVAAQPPDQPITKEEVLRRINEEAAQKAAEIRKLQQLKPQIESIEALRMMRKAESNRVRFHQEIRQIVLAKRPEAGRDLEQICEEFGRGIDPDLHQHISKLLKTTYANAPLRSKVALMRAWGAPEAMVFDFVANDVYRHLGTRGGPKNGDQVGIRAARVLLSMPPSAAKHAAPSTNATSASRLKPQH